MYIYIYIYISVYISIYIYRYIYIYIYIYIYAWPTNSVPAECAKQLSKTCIPENTSAVHPRHGVPNNTLRNFHSILLFLFLLFHITLHMFQFSKKSRYAPLWSFSFVFKPLSLSLPGPRAFRRAAKKARHNTLQTGSKIDSLPTSLFTHF